MDNIAPQPTLRPGETCYKIAQASEAAVIIDADDYFRIARASMIRAKKRIMLIGWDFDGRITLGRAAQGDDGPEHLGEFIYWLVQQNPDLEIFLLRWDVGAMKTFMRGSTIFTLMKWMAHKRIHTKLDGRHPFGASHHQKIVVIDECLAFCGGIDMTADRWDTREHRHKDDRRRRPSGIRYKPWHDATSAITGPMAGVIAEIARDRWHRAGGHRIEPLAPHAPCWPDGLVAPFHSLPMAVSRSAPEMADAEPVREIESLFIEQIARARHTIYAESQYFASRRIAEAVARRLDEPDGPEIVIINPLTAQGWLEPVAMDTARARLIEALKRRDRNNRFRMYHPFTDGGEAIYVHAKIMVVDDRVLRIGSSNMNNRSMRLDTECDVTIDADLANDPAVPPAILAIRDDLLAEHLGVEPARVTACIAEKGSLIGAIEALISQGKSLRPYETPDLTAVEEWLADNEVLDPEGPEEMFEPFEKRGLFRRMRRWRPRRRQRG